MINFTIAASGAALPRSEKVALVHIYRGARAIARIFDIAVANFDSLQQRYNVHPPTSSNDTSQSTG